MNEIILWIIMLVMLGVGMFKNIQVKRLKHELFKKNLDLKVLEGSNTNLNRRIKWYREVNDRLREHNLKYVKLYTDNKTKSDVLRFKNQRLKQQIELMQLIDSISKRDSSQVDSDNKIEQP